MRRKIKVPVQTAGLGPGAGDAEAGEAPGEGAGGLPN